MRMLLCLAATGVAAILFSLPLLTHTALPKGSDTAFAHSVADSLIQSLHEGETYPRWINNAANGFGAPLFVFYSPLAYYGVAAASLLTADLVAAFKLVLVLVAFLSGVSFYLAARPFGSDLGAAFGAAVYVLAPYHVLDLYDRFAFGEYAAFLWLPPLFLFVRRLLTRPTPAAWFGLVFTYAGLVLTHLVTAFMSLFALAPYGLFWLWRTKRTRNVLPLLGAGIAGLCLTAVFLIPALSGRGMVHSEWYVEPAWSRWYNNFVWPAGAPPAWRKPPVGLALAAQTALNALAAAWFIVRCRRHGSPRKELPAAASAEWTDGWAFLVLSVWTLFLQIPLSAPLWRIVPGLETVQFPWRFGMFHALAVSFLVASTLRPAPANTPTPAGAGRGLADFSRARDCRLPAALTIALLTIPLLVFDRRISGDRPYVFDAEMANNPAYVNIFKPEYFPTGWPQWRSFRYMPQARFPMATLTGPGTVEVVSWTNHGRRVRVRAEEPLRLALRTFAFPDWKAWADGKEVGIEPAPPFHSISIPLPKGEHLVTFAYQGPAERRAGLAVSAGTLATLLLAGAIILIR